MGADTIFIKWGFFKTNWVLKNVQMKGINMNYDEIDVDEVLENAASAVAQGKYRKATKKESMEVRLAALSAIVHEMQVIIQNDKELARTWPY